MNEIQNYLPRPRSRERIVKCLSQEHNKEIRVGFKPKPGRSKSRIS